MPTSQTAVGDYNRNGQILLENTQRPGTDHRQYVWVVECARAGTTKQPCGHRYGVNGADFFERKRPVCQNGRPGLSIEGI
jgi:hypothetical protein